MKIKRGDKIGIIGFMPTVIKDLQELGAEVTFVGSLPERADLIGCNALPSYQSLVDIDKAFITGSSQIKPSFAEILTHIHKQVSDFAFLGLAAGTLPDARCRCLFPG